MDSMLEEVNAPSTQVAFEVIHEALRRGRVLLVKVQGQPFTPRGVCWNSTGVCW